MAGKQLVKISPKAQMLVVGRDIDGSWTVKESAGELLGRFPTDAAAEAFARGQRKARPETSIACSAGARPRLKGRLSLASVRGGVCDENA
jgi:hypothetical protein